MRLPYYLSQKSNDFSFLSEWGNSYGQQPYPPLQTQCSCNGAASHFIAKKKKETALKLPGCEYYDLSDVLAISIKHYSRSIAPRQQLISASVQYKSHAQVGTRLHFRVFN